MILLLCQLVFAPMVQPIYQNYIQFHPASYTTPIHELEKSHKIVRGLVCWHPMEVKCIDGVCGENGSYWMVKVNGDSLHYNGNSKIKPTDSVEWEFIDAN